MKGIMRWVSLHPYNIAQKVQVVVEHFRENVAPLLDGKAKAMVVVSSRLEAVRWQLAIERYIKDQGYKLATLVAFSGEVNDPASGPEPFTETSALLNPNLKGRDMREAFATSEYQILLVANKFQTGFDQPLLCGMYVDKRLAGIQAVQTLSRLNRAHPGKDTTYVLDFVNEPQEVLEAFQTYYETASLEDVTDPHLVYNLRSKLDSAGFYDSFEVDRVAEVTLKANATQAELSAALAPVADRLLKQFKAAQAKLKAAKEAKDSAAEQAATDELNVLVLFKRDMGSYVNNVLKGKLLESEILVQQAANNTKEQFANSPDLKTEIMNAIMDAFAAHSTMSKQALDSERVRVGLRDILLGPAQLYEALRGKGGAAPPV